jgi:hypothetical protein
VGVSTSLQDLDQSAYSDKGGQLRIRPRVVRKVVGPELESWCDDTAGVVGGKPIEGGNDQGGELSPRWKVQRISRVVGQRWDGRKLMVSVFMLAWAMSVRGLWNMWGEHER